MAAVDESHDTAPRRRPAGITPGESMMGDKLDDLTAEVRALREKAPSPTLLLGAALGFFGMMFASQVYLISGLLATRGVDLGAAAGATSEVVHAGASAAPSTTTTTTTETVSPFPAPPPVATPPAPAE